MFLQSLLLNNFSDYISHGFFCSKNLESRSLNVSFNDTFDDINTTIENRKKIMEILGGNFIYFNKQNHSNQVVYIDSINIKKIKNYPVMECVADSIITNIKNIVIGVYTADCVPLLIFDKLINQVACVHVSSKTLKDDIIKNTIIKMMENNTKNKIELDRFYSCLGPSIYVESYQVKKDFYMNFIQKSETYSQFFIPIQEGYLFNLQEAIVYELNKYNIFNIDKIYKNTAIDEKYYSYRRSLGVEKNRQASLIMLK